MVIISLYKTINSFVQKNDLFCTKECNLLYKGAKSYIDTNSIIQVIKRKKNINK